MRIIYISTSTIPAIAANTVHVMKMCEALKKQGCHVELLAIAGPKKFEVYGGDVFSHYGVMNKFPIRYLGKRRRWFRGAGYSILAALKVWRAKPDLVIGRDLGGCALSSLLGVRTIFEAHSITQPHDKIQDFIFRNFFRSKFLFRFVTISDALRKEYITSYPFLERKCRVLPDCASQPSGGKKAIKTRDNENRLRVGYVGSLYIGRGVDFLIQVAEACRWAEFHFVGGTRAEVEYWLSKVDSQENCFFHGFVPPAITDRYLSSFDILVAPYEEGLEVAGGGASTAKWMSPLKVFEYMAAKKPIVCSDIPVLREILMHNVNCLLCPPRNKEEWVRALSRVRDDERLQLRLSSQAYSDFLEKYTWDSRARRILSWVA